MNLTSIGHFHLIRLFIKNFILKGFLIVAASASRFMEGQLWTGSNIWNKSWEVGIALFAKRTPLTRMSFPSTWKTTLRSSRISSSATTRLTAVRPFARYVENHLHCRGWGVTRRVITTCRSGSTRQSLISNTMTWWRRSSTGQKNAK